MHTQKLAPGSILMLLLDIEAGMVGNSLTLQMWVWCSPSTDPDDQPCPGMGNCRSHTSGTTCKGHMSALDGHPESWLEIVQKLYLIIRLDQTAHYAGPQVISKAFWDHVQINFSAVGRHGGRLSVLWALS